MKAKQLLCAAMGMLLIASCSNELPIERAEESIFGTVPEGMMRFEFKLSGVKPTTSYAGTTVALEEAEMELGDATVIVTQIKADDQANAKVYGVFPGKIAQGFASITIPKDTPLGTKEEDGDHIRFVVVANQGWTNVATITTASKYSDVEALTATWAPERLNEIDPLPVGLPSFAITDQPRPEAEDVLKVTDLKLKRPIARFDVRNSTQGALTITKLGLVNMRIGGNLLKGDVLEMFDGSSTLATFPDWGTIPAALNQFDQLDANNNPTSGLQPCVFYCSPGKAADNIQLIVEGDLLSTSGTDHVTYVLPLQKEGQSLAVAANQRYTITIKKVNGEIFGSIGFVQDGWGEGDGGGGGGGSGDDDYEHEIDPDALGPDPAPVP